MHKLILRIYYSVYLLYIICLCEDQHKIHCPFYNWLGIGSRKFTSVCVRALFGVGFEKRQVLTQHSFSFGKTQPACMFGTCTVCAVHTGRMMRGAGVTHCTGCHSYRRGDEKCQCALLCLVPLVPLTPLG